MKNIVKQGTVYGPPICAASIDTINKIGYDAVTHYGPNVEVKIVAYVDDLGSAGSDVTANKTIQNCNIMSWLPSRWCASVVGRCATRTRILGVAICGGVQKWSDDTIVIHANV